MTTELSLLAWAIVLGLVHAIATGQFTTIQHGLSYGMSPRDQHRPVTGIGVACSGRLPITCRRSRSSPPRCWWRM